MAKIVIEIDGIRCEFNGEVEITQERGLETEYGVNGAPLDIKPNGHRRIMLKAWSGCRTFDSFMPRTTKQ